MQLKTIESLEYAQDAIALAIEFLEKNDDCSDTVDAAASRSVCRVLLAAYEGLGDILTTLGDDDMVQIENDG